jgi:ribose transport system substrate-binding protein
MKRRWRLVQHCFLLLSVAVASGCTDTGSSGSTSPQTDKKPKIALVMKSLANEFFKTMADGASAYQASRADAFDLILNGIKDERDLTRQVGLVEEMIAAQVDAIVLAPADSKALVSVCKRAQAKGITVVNIDNKMDVEVLSQAGVTIPFVGPDNRAGARKVGEYVATKLKPGAKVGILEGIRTAFNAQQRRLGFEDAMAAAKIEVVDSQSAQWEMNIANKVAAAMLGEHPEIQALLCCNDSMALGALAAVKAAGRTEVLVAGFDNISAVQKAVRDGNVVATADQHGDQLAVFGIEYALQIIAGEAAPQDKETPVDLVTAETLK